MGGKYYPPEPPDLNTHIYTRASAEQRMAFAECLQKLFDEFPSHDKSVLHNRSFVLDEVLRGRWWTASANANKMKVPRDRIEAIEALLF